MTEKKRSHNPYSQKFRRRKRFNIVGLISLTFLNLYMVCMLLRGGDVSEPPLVGSIPEATVDGGKVPQFDDTLKQIDGDLDSLGESHERRHLHGRRGPNFDRIAHRVQAKRGYQTHHTEDKLDAVPSFAGDDDFLQVMTEENVVIDKSQRKYDKEICKFYNFAVTGFAKCATTAIHAWLDLHKDTRVAKGEMVHTNSNPLETVQKIQYRIAEQGPGINGYCNPHDIQWPGSLDFFVNSCPQTKLIVSVRHPVLWFESFYNYRKVNNHEWAIKGSPNELIIRSGDERDPDPFYVNSANGAFHKYLAVLGKTPLHDDEMELLGGWYENMDEFRRGRNIVTNPIFLLESTQTAIDSSEQFAQLNHDLTVFLGLSTELPNRVPHINTNKAGQSKGRRFKKQIDICDPEYKPIHDEMMLIAKNSAAWIRDYFVKSPDVHYSGNFLDILDGWNSDPCDTRKNSQEE